MRNWRVLPNLPRRGLSHVEALTFLFVVGVLAALLFPMIRGEKTICRRTKEHTVVKNVVNAVKQYERDYGTFPQISQAKLGEIFLVGDPVSGTRVGNAVLFDTLRARPVGA